MLSSVLVINWMRKWNKHKILILLCWCFVFWTSSLSSLSILGFCEKQNHEQNNHPQNLFLVAGFVPPQQQRRRRCNDGRDHQQHQSPCTSTTSPFVLRRYSATTSTGLFADQKRENTNDDNKSKNKSKKRTSTRGGKNRRNKTKKTNTNNPSSSIGFDPNQPQIWRVYGITIHPDHLPSLTEDASEKTSVVYQLLDKALQKKLPSLSSLSSSTNTTNNKYSFRVVRRSLDARKKLPYPQFNYIVDVTIPPSSSAISKQWKIQSGKLERLVESEFTTTNEQQQRATTSDSQEEKSSKEDEEESSSDIKNNSNDRRKKVVIVGAGPAGLFCALQLLKDRTRNLDVVLLDRGQPVEQRGRDIGALIHRRTLNRESNFAFGEGGAGTWSDGKLTTRIGRNSELVRKVLAELVKFGAPSTILWEGSPHLGTDNLVRLLRNMRHYILSHGNSQILFGTKMTDLIYEEEPEGADTGETEGEGKVQGINAVQSDGTQIEIRDADAVVLATGHSARDVYESLHNDTTTASAETSSSKLQLEPKGFAVGFRIEHPQTLITDIQYGKEWGPTVKTGRAKTDAINMEYFSPLSAAESSQIGKEGEDEDSSLHHKGRLPVPSYRLAADKAIDGTSIVEDVDGNHGGNPSTRGVYSFCMCPGGQIVPSSSEPDEVCVNGMSFSRRDSVWANSALVVTISHNDKVLEAYRQKFGDVMAGVEFQKAMERRAAIFGGGNWTVPVQRVTDFIKGQVSTTIPPSSYRLGVKSAPCHEIYPEQITTALRDALTNHFEKQMPGYCHEDALLHGVETRTSSPLRVSRDRTTLQAMGVTNVFPAGEGAGFAGGIVSAAVDGTAVAEAILDQLYDRSDSTSAKSRKKSANLGFSY